MRLLLRVARTQTARPGYHWFGIDAKISVKCKQLTLKY